MSLALSSFLQLAMAFAPSVAPETLASFAHYESRLDPYAIHDNTTGATLHPESQSQAIALATSLLAHEHSLDLGIMQVNSGNLSWVGLTVATAFDPGQSIRAGAVVLVAAYQRCRRDGAVAEQPALRCAASVYNTGNEQAGILNGYQPRVWLAATQIVPAIQAVRAAGIEPLLPPQTTAAGTGADVATPSPRRPPAGLRDTLHASPPVPDSSDELVDALHASRSPVQPEKDVQ